jgi:transcriptional regulator with XRE-family HTH domain
MPEYLEETQRKAIGVRVKEFRLSLGLTARELAAAVGQRQASFALVESGRNLFSVHVLARLVELYGLNATWLLTGYGPMRLPPVVNGQVAEPAGIYAGRYPMATVPLLEGYPRTSDEIAAVEPQGRVQVIRSLVPHPHHTYAARTRGSAMRPVILDGWLVLVDVHPEALQPEALHGRPVVAKLSEGITLRWFEARKDWVLYPEDERAGKAVRISRMVDPPILGRVIYWCPV